MKTNQAGLDIIKKWEGFRERAYQDTGGVWTIGYGTTAMAGVGISPSRGILITKEQAEDYLRKYLVKVEAQIMSMVSVPLNENQFSALVSFVYNIGPTQFRGSTLLKKLNTGDYEGAANEFKRWNKDNGKVLNGLVARRKDEEALFRASGTQVTEQSNGLVEALLAILRGIFK